MQRFLLIFLTASTLCAYGQDTTGNRLVGINNFAELVFFDDDSLDFLTIGTGLSTGHGIFEHPVDGKLYALIDASFGDRNFYEVEPFTGGTTLSYNAAIGYFNSADITGDGRVFATVGNALPALVSSVHEIDLAAGTETQVVTSTAGANLGLAIEYNPVDDNLHIYAANDGVSGAGIYTVELDTWTQGFIASTFGSTEVHGAYHDQAGGEVLVSTFGGEFWRIIPSVSWDATQFNTLSESVMDLTEIDLVVESDTGYCEGSTVTLNARYESSTYQWYMDGVSLAGETNASLETSAEGEYMLLAEIGSGGGAYMWSEPVNVASFTTPVVDITSTDTAICSGDTAMLTGASGGALQWFLDGSPIAGATASTLIATEPGLYRQSKTNMSGCENSGEFDLLALPPEDCGEDTTSGFSDLVLAGLRIYPVPASTDGGIVVESTVLSVDRLRLHDLHGRLLNEFRVEGAHARVPLDGLAPGVYLLEVIAGERTWPVRVAVE